VVAQEWNIKCFEQVERMILMMRIPWFYESSRICSRMFVALTALFVVVHSGSALAAPQGQMGRSAFNSTCASCHGQNGTPTAVGKSLNAPNLGSEAVQHQTDAELRQIIANGKGNMPPFKGSLSEAQINSLIAHIRTFSEPRK
jgi:cytochrome c6